MCASSWVKRADAEEAVQHARQLVPVDVAELGVADRQLAVGVPAAAVDQAGARAVHRLDREALLVDLREVHVLAVVVPVAAGLPELGLEDRRRLDLGVVHVRELLAHGLLDAVDDDHAPGQEEREARAEVVEVEELEVAAEAAVVAGLGLLQALEVGLEVLLVGERGGVEPRELGVLLAAAPVGAGHRLELDRPDAAGVLHVRAATEVDEVAVAVERHRGLALAGEVVDLVDLVGVLALDEELARVGDAHHRALERRLGGDDARHLGLDGREVLLGDGPGGVEVVVEAVVDRRAEAELGPRDQRLDGLRHDVRGGVPHDVEVVVAALRRDDLDRVAVGQGQGEVAHLVAHAHGDRGLGQARSDRGGGVVPGGPLGQLEPAAVGRVTVIGGGW